MNGVAFILAIGAACGAISVALWVLLGWAIAHPWIAGGVAWLVVSFIGALILGAMIRNRDKEV